MMTLATKYSNISYKDFVTARNELRDQIRNEKKQEAKPTGAKKQ
jgi:hypothetical protein